MNKNIGDMNESELKDFIVELEEENMVDSYDISNYREDLLN